jgi:nucleoside-diphosphate-sugar epimerase
LKVTILGAGGGIGRRLTSILGEGHWVAAVYRSLPEGFSEGVGETISFADDDGLRAAVKRSDLVVHAALNSRLRGEKFLEYNAAITNKVLSLLDPVRTRLFVYFSSQVVYSGMAARAAAPYSEADELRLDRPVDDYTRLKFEDEKRVISSCRELGVPYLIVRPTVVMGPNMLWSTQIVKVMRLVPVGIKSRIMNLIHVDDLCRCIRSLVEQNIANEVFNLGDKDFSTDDYFRQAGALARRPVVFLPNGLISLLSSFIPSTVWFLREDVRIRCEKIREVAPINSNRAIADYFPDQPEWIEGADIETIRQTNLSGKGYQARGQGYSFWFSEPKDTNQLSLRNYSGILGMQDDLITVKAGTTLSEIVDYLDRHGLTIPTLPEFAGISAGACFFTEVHGSSSEYLSMYDLIEQIGYVDEGGTERISKKDVALWEELRARSSDIALTQLSFRCVPAHLLANRIEWEDDDALESLVANGHKKNKSTTVQWFPRKNKVLIYNINAVDARSEGDRRAFAPVRGLPYALQRALIQLHMGKNKRIVDKSHKILAPWRGVPGRRLLAWSLRRRGVLIRNMEICVAEENVPSLITHLRAQIAGGHFEIHRGQGIGIRFSTDNGSGRSYVWIEITSRHPEQLDTLVDMVRSVCGDAFWFHRGKYYPDNAAPSSLLLRRAVPMVSEVPRLPAKAANLL